MTEKLEELRALIGLRMCDGVGDATAYKLIMHYGAAAKVFEEKRKHLSNIPGISPRVMDLLSSAIDWNRVDKELRFIEDNCINYVTIFDEAYPQRLLNIDTPPLVLFFTGSIEKLNQKTCVSIVGTRLATGYGISAVEEIVGALKKHDINIVSGLALGIDIMAHKESMRHGITTFGVVAHGIKTIYPSIHSAFAKQMQEQGGGIITEFLSGETPNRENFPKRNRIIAGLSFSTIVVEAAKKGGALITAELALSYQRNVFVVPGRYNDKFSEGCNSLLKRKGVLPVLSIHGLMENLGLTGPRKKNNISPAIPLDPDESILMKILSQYTKISLDNISAKSQLNISVCSSLLFNLELKGLIRSLPGKAYELF